MPSKSSKRREAFRIIGWSRLLPRPSRPEVSDPVAMSERHWQRLEFARRHSDKLEDWSRARGVELKVSKDGMEWLFRRGDTAARWVPLVGWLRFCEDVRKDRRWYGGKTHEYEQVIAVLQWVFP